jgi:hypothetical protein
VYPELGAINYQLLREHTERIEKLEQFIRSLGGDPKLADDAQSPRRLGERTSQENTKSNGSCRNEATITSWPLSDELSPASRVRQPVPRASELLAQGDGVTCIET